MATNVGAIEYDARINSANFKKDAQDIDNEAKTLGDRVSSSFKAAEAGSKALLLGVTAAAAGAVAFGISSVKAFQESQDAQAQLTAVLKSTHGAAGLYIEDLNDQAKALQRLTKFSDEQINSGQALLLTFTDLKGPVVQQATETILDMSTALGQDLKSSAIQLGKALQDPVLGITALRRVGVNFSDAQKDVIAKLVETGHKAEAQQLILKELKTEFGGSAIAAGQTFGGALERLKNNFNDLQEQVGQTIVQALTPLADSFAGWIAKVNEAGGLMNYLRDLFQRNKDTIILFAGAIVGGLVPAVFSLAAGFVAMVIPLLPFMALGAALFYLWDKNKILFFALTGAIIGFATAILISMLPAIIASTVAFGGMAIAVIAATWPFILIGAVAAAAAYLIITNWDTVKNFLAGIWNWIKANWPLLIGILTGPFGFAVAMIIRNWDTILNFFRSLPGTIKGFFSNAGQWLQDAGKAIIDGLINGIKNKFNDVKSTLGDLTKKLTSWKGPASVDRKLLAGSGQMIIDGFIKGLESKYGAVQNSLGGLTTSISGPNIANPSTSPALQSINSVGDLAATSGSGSSVVINVDMNGIMTRSRSDMRTVAKDLVNSIDEELSAKGLPKIMPSTV